MGATSVLLAGVGGGEAGGERLDTLVLPWAGEDGSAAGRERKMGLVMFPK